MLAITLKDRLFQPMPQSDKKILQIVISSTGIINHLWLSNSLNGQCVNQESVPANQQAEQLIACVDRLLQGYSPSLLERIIVNQGPGSFTGIRIGIAAAHGLALGWQIPCFSFDNFTVAAHYAQHYYHNLGQELPEKWLILLPAGHLQWYGHYWLHNHPSPLGAQLYHETDTILLAKHIPVWCFTEKNDSTELSETPYLAANFDTFVTIMPSLIKEWTTNSSILKNDIIPLYVRASAAEEKKQKTY
jgi:tRNA threonylcarbamoyl adenosine modification protein YeaZ